MRLKNLPIKGLPVTQPGYADETYGAVERSPVGGAIDASIADGARPPSTMVHHPPPTPRRQQAAFRLAVRNRDACVCRVCKVDTAALWDELDTLFHEVRRGGASLETYLDTLREYGVDSPTYASPPALWHADHVIPLWAGGTNDLSNGQLLCLKCHRIKTQRENLARFCDHAMLDSDGSCSFCGSTAVREVSPL